MFRSIRFFSSDSRLGYNIRQKIMYRRIRNYFKENSNNSNTSNFVKRHIGPNEQEKNQMLKFINCSSIDNMVTKIVPYDILESQQTNIGSGEDEHTTLNRLKFISKQNSTKYLSLIGTGYHGTLTPPVIKRNILENPDWYTSYTPYQAEISQGRLEALLIYQTMVKDLTAMDIANSSLLDESTSAGEAMSMAFNFHKKKKKTFLASTGCHPQTLAVLETRAKSLGIELIIVELNSFNFTSKDICGIIVQYPRTDGVIIDYEKLVSNCKDNNIVTICAADILALTLIKPPGEIGFDITVGTTQRLGVPIGFGGPAAGYISIKDKFKRLLPGRLIGISKDSQGNKAYRMTLQTREQHIKRENATSNICTAQALLANISAFYAVYHGPVGLKEIATKIHNSATRLYNNLQINGYKVCQEPFFDTIKISFKYNRNKLRIIKYLKTKYINIRDFDSTSITITIDETVTDDNIRYISDLFRDLRINKINIESRRNYNILSKFRRKSKFLTHKVFNNHHSEIKIMRFIRYLSSKDMSLTQSMIPLGSCTMKLNSAAEMEPITWDEFSSIHPFVPDYQRKGYKRIIKNLESYLASITGFSGVSLQPNSGSQGEYAGLLIIKKYHEDIGEKNRNVCFIPTSAHGTNPASAQIAGMDIVKINVNKITGNIDMDDLKNKCEKYKNTLSAIMITYPSTYGVYEDNVKDICNIIHEYGGQIYMDGANMNAQVGITSPGLIGADVCHLNLHKTFTVPHGGGGPGIGPVCVASHLVPYLPNHPLVNVNDNKKSIGTIAAAPWGSAGILPIVWMYIKMMGDYGLKEASKIAMLNANYMAKRLEQYYKILYKGNNGLVAHEFIIDLKEFKSIGITEDDIAKRLMDYSLHAPTMSWPVPASLMIEPTESESKDELDRFISAMISIRGEIREIEEGKIKVEDSPLKHAPHTQQLCLSDTWEKKYSREKAVYPLDHLRKNKFWTTVSRIDNVYGDRNLFCSCGEE